MTAEAPHLAHAPISEPGAGGVEKGEDGDASPTLLSTPHHQRGTGVPPMQLSTRRDEGGEGRSADEDEEDEEDEEDRAPLSSLLHLPVFDTAPEPLPPSSPPSASSSSSESVESDPPQLIPPPPLLQELSPLPPVLPNLYPAASPPSFPTSMFSSLTGFQPQRLLRVRRARRSLPSSGGALHLRASAGPAPPSRNHASGAVGQLASGSASALPVASASRLSPAGALVRPSVASLAVDGQRTVHTAAGSIHPDVPRSPSEQQPDMQSPPGIHRPAAPRPAREEDGQREQRPSLKRPRSQAVAGAALLPGTARAAACAARPAGPNDGSAMPRLSVHGYSQPGPLASPPLLQRPSASAPTSAVGAVQPSTVGGAMAIDWWARSIPASPVPSSAAPVAAQWLPPIPFFHRRHCPRNLLHLPFFDPFFDSAGERPPVAYCFACQAAITQLSDPALPAACSTCGSRYHSRCFSHCPRHRCYMCSEEDAAQQRSERLYTCLLCPRSFCFQHASEKPARFSSLPGIGEGAATARLLTSLAGQLVRQTASVRFLSTLSLSQVGVCGACARELDEEDMWRALRSKRRRGNMEHTLSRITPQPP